jgi:hypothetical protein
MKNNNLREGVDFMQGKKPGAGKNKLLDTIVAVLENRMRSDNLTEVLETSITKLEENRGQFNAWVTSLSSDVKSDNYDLINNVDNLFKEYQNVLEEATSFVINRDRTVLESVPQKITRITENLNREMFMFSQVALKAMGPTEFPGINRIVATVRRITEGEDLAEELKQHIIREIAIIEDTLFEMDKSHKGEFPPEIRVTFEDMLDSLDQFSEYFESGDSAILRTLVDNLINISREFKSHGGSHNIRELARKPTPSPIANIVINSTRGLKDSTIDAEFVTSYLDKLRGQYLEMKDQYNAMLNLPPESAMVQEEAQVLGKILEVFEDTINKYYEMIASQNFDNLVAVENVLVDIIAAIEKSMNKFQKLAMSEGMVTCVKCGHMNPGVNKKCEKCNGVLPVFNRAESSQVSVTDCEGGIGNSQTVMTEKVQKLLSAIESFESSKIDAQEFQKILSEMETDLNQAYRAAGPLPPMEPAQEGDSKGSKVRVIMEKASQFYLQGLEEFKTGLVMLRVFASTNSVDSKQTGTQKIWQGMEKLQQVQRLLEPLVNK